MAKKKTAEKRVKEDVPERNPTRSNYEKMKAMDLHDVMGIILWHRRGDYGRENMANVELMLRVHGWKISRIDEADKWASRD